MSSEVVSISGVSISSATLPKPKGKGKAVPVAGGSGDAVAVQVQKESPSAAKPEAKNREPRERQERPVAAPRTPLSSYQSIYTDKPEYKAFTAESETNFADKLNDSQRSALGHYKGSGYHGINGELRGQLTPTAKNQGYIKRIDSALENATLGRDLVLYRGFSAKTEHKIGEVYEDKGFMSTSLNPNKAFHGQHFLKIHAKGRIKGAFIEPKRVYDKHAPKGTLHGLLEHEVLLARGTRYVVVGKSKVKTMSGEREALDVVILQ